MLPSSGTGRPVGPAHRHPLSTMLLPRADTMQALFLSDVELGKKDDDHNRSSKGGGHGHHGHGHGPHWTGSRVPPRRLLKRVVLTALAVLAVYLFIRNMPAKTAPREHRHPVYYQPGRGAHPPYPPGSAPEAAAAGADAPPVAAPKLLPPKTAPPYGDSSSPQDKAAYTYEGPLRVDRLLATLRTVTSPRASQMNKHVLFAAASLRSITALLPAACEMGMEMRNNVHFAVMGRSEIDLEDLQQMNGIDESCRILFHDGRPDHSATSTEERMRLGVEHALKQIDSYMHPQAIIVDSAAEEPFLLETLHVFDRYSGSALIELPDSSARRVGWFTKLDSTALANWNKITIDILIHAYPGASGSLIRLLKSLSEADFDTGSVPHVTIELPQAIDPPTEEFLAGFRWPPVHGSDAYHEQQLSLRHRIPKHGISEEDSSVRFLESFWPVHPQHSHVLVLSPQTELSPDFFHYVKYALLEYRYSLASIQGGINQRLFGISLDLPTTSLDGKKFTVPSAGTSAGAADEDAGTQGSASFLWQAPNSNAMLFTGDHWRELHNFVAALVERDPTAVAAAQPPAKVVSKKYPSWLEYALQLCEARGYWTLYPSAAVAGALATVHNELYRPPEEYEKDVTDAASAREGIEAGAEAGANQDDEVQLQSGTTLMDALPRTGSLPRLADMVLLSWEGKATTLEAFDAQAVAFAKSFRRSVGGCSAADLEGLPASVLFCQRKDQEKHK